MKATLGQRLAAIAPRPDQQTTDPHGNNRDTHPEGNSLLLLQARLELTNLHHIAAGGVGGPLPEQEGAGRNEDHTKNREESHDRSGGSDQGIRPR